MEIVTREDVMKRVDIERAYALQKLGFQAFSEGRVVQPPVGHLDLPEGSLHIKYGMIAGDDEFVVKLATGFSGNWKQGHATGDGLLTTFCSKTGQLRRIILDGGYLSDLRTALAARLAAECFGQSCVDRVGILGTGAQARLVAMQQARSTQCRKVLVWGRSRERVQAYCQDMVREGFDVTPVASPLELVEQADIVFTTTSSRGPLLPYSTQMRAQLIVAIGADERGKQELDPQILVAAGKLVADSPAQCLEIGELQHVRHCIDPAKITALGEILGGAHDRTAGFTVVDLTGLAIQDIQMVKSLGPA